MSISATSSSSVSAPQITHENKTLSDARKALTHYARHSNEAWPSIEAYINYHNCTDSLKAQLDLWIDKVIEKREPNHLSDEPTEEEYALLRRMFYVDPVKLDQFYQQFAAYRTLDSLNQGFAVLKKEANEVQAQIIKKNENGRLSRITNFFANLFTTPPRKGIAPEDDYIDV